MKYLFDKTEKSSWFVTENGDVFRVTSGKEYTKRGSVHSRGYVYVRTTNGNYQLHRLVAEAFIPNTEKKRTVNHKDGNKQNNSISNLEWATHKENAQHALKNNLTRQMKKNEGKLKYTNEQCREVLQRIKEGMTYIKAGSIWDMPYSTVAHLARGSRRLV